MEKKLTERQRRAMLVVRDQGETQPDSMVLRRALGGYVRATMRSLMNRGLVERRQERKDHATGHSIRYFGWVLTPAGKKLMEGR
jgi:hypothetical protein